MIDKETEAMLNKLIGGLTIVRSAADSLFGCVPMYPPSVVGQVMGEVADLVEHARKVQISAEQTLRRHKDT